MTGIASQYALAVFSLAKEQDKEVEYLKLLENFSEVIDEKTLKFFQHPKISKADKKALLDKTVDEELLKNFFKVLVDNERISLIKGIALAYKDILDDLNKVMQVKVFCNKPLTKTNLDKISKKLKSTYQRKIELEVIKDETIIGGFKIEFEGNVIDETVNKQLDDIKSSLID